MKGFIEIIIGLILIIPLTMLMTTDLTDTSGFLYNATATSVGDDGDFVLVLFQFWPILFGLGLFALAVYLVRRKFSEWRGFGNDQGGK